MKKVLMLLTVIFFINFQSVSAFGNVVIPTGVGEQSDLERDNLVLVEHDVNFNVPGNYHATYFSNASNSFVESNVYVVNDNVLKEGYSITNNRFYNYNDSVFIKKVIYVSKTEYYRIGEVDNNYNNPTPRQDRWPLAYLEYYQNNQKIWERKFEIESTFNDAYLTDRGLILGGRHFKNDNMNSWIIEISKNNQIIRSIIYEENVTSEINAILLNDERLNICETRRLKNSPNRMIHYKELNYHNLNLISESIIGNNGFNSIIKVAFFEDELYGVIRFAGDSGGFVVNSEYTFTAVIKVDGRSGMVDYVKIDSFWSIDDIFVNADGVTLLRKEKIGSYWNFYIEKYSTNVYDPRTTFTWMHDEIVSSMIDPLIRIDGRGDFLLCYGTFKTSKIINVVKFSSDNEIRFHYRYNVSNLIRIFQINQLGEEIKVIYGDVGADEKYLNYNFNLTYIKIIKSAPTENSIYINENYDVCINNYPASKKAFNPYKYTSFGNYNIKRQYYLANITLFYNNNLFIKPKISLENGETYDNDISLSFNGTGYLNNTLIENNHIIEKDGNYNFRLVNDNGDEISINFTVSDLCYDEKDYQEATNFSEFMEISETQSEEINHIITHGEAVLDSDSTNSLEKVFFTLIFILIGGLLGFLIPFKSKVFLTLVLVFVFVGGVDLSAHSIYQEKETEINEIVVYEKNNYKIISDFDKRLRLVLYEDGELIKTLDLKSAYLTVDVFEIDEQVVIMYIDQIGYLNKIEISSDWESFTKQKIFESRFSSEIEWLEYENKRYLVGQVIIAGAEFQTALSNKNITGRSACIIKFSNNFEFEDLNVYGGNKTEFFYSITALNDTLFVLGKKEYLAGGEFGNGGVKNKCNMVLAKISLDLDLLDFKIIVSANKALKILNFEEDIIVVGDNIIASFDEELYCNYYVETLNMNNAFKTKANKLLVLENDKIILYNPFTMEKEVFEVDRNFTEITYHTNYENLRLFFLGEENYLKEVEIYNLDNYNSEITFGLEEDKSKVLGLFNELELIESSNTDYFSENIFGEYKSIEKYKSGDLEFLELEKTILVPLRVNVREGEVYPLGYNLFFSGKANLNGSNIENNHSVNKLNQNKLILTGLNQTSEVNFLVESLAVKYDEDFYLEWDYEFFKGQTVKINISLSDLSVWEVKGFIVNDNFETNFTVEEGIVTLELPKYNESGVYKLHISKVYLEKDKYKHVINLNKYLRVRILKDMVSLNSRIENKKLNISLIDLENCSRYLEINLVSNLKNYNKRISLYNQMIYFEGLEKTNYEGSINLLCDYGNKKLVSLELAKISFDANDIYKIASFEITKSSNQLEEFTLDFKPSTLSSVTSGNNIIELNQNNFEITTFFIALFSAVASFVIMFFIKRKIFKKV